MSRKRPSSRHRRQAKDFYASIPSDPEALVLQLMDVMARSHFDHFLQMFYRDFSDTVDFDRGWKLLDDELPRTVPAEMLDQPNALNYLAEVTLKTGKPCRFAVHFINQGAGVFQCGLSLEQPGSPPWMAIRLQNSDGGFSAN